jgi:hypothetical protein
VSIKTDNNIIKPYMQIRSDKANDAETLLHELLHSYTWPYLYAWAKQLAWDIEITDPAQKQRAIEHFRTIKTLYDQARAWWHSVINWSSIEDNIDEFVANVTQKNSVQKLTELWIYEPLMAELKKHKEAIRSLEIPFTVPVKKVA